MQVVFRIDRRGVEPPCPRRPTSTVTSVEFRHVAASDTLHEPPERPVVTWSNEQSDVVVHERKGMNGNRARARGVSQRLHIEKPVRVVDEHGLLVLASLDNEVRLPGDNQARLTGHG